MVRVRRVSRVFQCRQAEAGDAVVSVRDPGAVGQRQAAHQGARGASYHAGVAVAERAGRGSQGVEAAGGIIAVGLGPRRSVRSLNAQAGPQSVGVSVAHGVTGPRAVFTEKLAHAIVTVARRADAINHVREAVQRVVMENNVAGNGINDVGEVADGIVAIACRALGWGPAIGEAAVEVVFVEEQEFVEGVELVGDAAKLVIDPDGGLVFAVNEVGQAAGGVVAELGDFEIGVGFGDFSAGLVVTIAGDEAELVGIGDEAAGGIPEMLDAAVGIIAL